MRLASIVRWVCLALVVVVATAQGGQAENRPNPRVLDTVLDGRPVRISLEPVSQAQSLPSFEWKVRVRATGGHLLWESSVGYGDHGAFTALQLAGDIDSDGRTELVMRSPAFDVRARTFSVLRWQGGEFKYLYGGTLIETPTSSGRFPFSLRQAGTGVWIREFTQARGHGVIVASVSQVTTRIREGRAEFRCGPRGCRLIRWIQRPK